MSLEDSISQLSQQYSNLSTRINALETRNTGPTILTKLEFENRLTWDEQVAIEEASTTDAGIRVLKAKQAKADYIDLVDENTVLGLMYLASKGFLTPARVDEILYMPTLESHIL